jgi:hypothetical protein
VIWHDGPPFTKTIRLDGTRLDIRYRNAPAGHMLDNEFALDVRAAMTRGAFQTGRTRTAAGSACSGPAA